MNTIKDFLNSIDHIYIFVFLFILCLGFWAYFHAEFLAKHTEAILAAITTAAVIKRGDNNLYSDSNNSYTNVENKNGKDDAKNDPEKGLSPGNL